VKPFDIHALLAGLAEKRPVFHSEADFQFALAWQIKEQTGLDVRLEYPHIPKERVYLDIWLPEVEAAIELKYFKKKLDVEVGGEQFALPNQGAQDINRYHFVSDIERVEGAGRGFAVALTNDPGYWTRGIKEHPIDAAFRLHEGRTLPANKPLAWARHAATGLSKRPVRLQNSYALAWRDYGPPLAGTAEAGNRQFRYLAVKAERRDGRGPAARASEMTDPA